MRIKDEIEDGDNKDFLEKAEFGGTDHEQDKMIKEMQEQNEREDEQKEIKEDPGRQTMKIDHDHGADYRGSQDL